MLINFQWRAWKKRIMVMRIIPWVTTLIAFWIWSNIILQHSHHDKLESTTLRELRGHGSRASTLSNLISSNNSDNQFTTTQRWRQADIALCYTLIVCSTYFLLTEIESFIFSPQNYVSNWLSNATDLIPLIFLYKQTSQNTSNIYK